jgi:hypothetical protein
VLNGKTVAFKGSPNGSGTFWDQGGEPPDETVAADSRLTKLLRKKEAIRRLFANEGQLFEIQGYDGLNPSTCNPRIKSIVFNEGIWFDYIEYQINLEADIMYLAGASGSYEDKGIIEPVEYFVSKVAETWNLEPNDERKQFYKLTHNVSAVGKRHYDAAGHLTQEAWKNAQDWVLDHIGVDTNIKNSPNLLSLAGHGVYQKLQTESTGESDGTYGVTETWVLFDPGADVIAAFNDYSVTGRYSLETGQNIITVDGTITGFETYDQAGNIVNTRYASALAKWNAIEADIPTVAFAAFSVPVNSTAFSKTEGRNDITGVITYSHEFNDRRTPLITGAVTEIVSVSYNRSTNVFAQVPIIGRSDGPILQDIGTINAFTKTIQIEAVLLPETLNHVAPAEPSTDALVSLYIPSATQVFRDQDDISWSPHTGRYTRSVRWVYQ